MAIKTLNEPFSIAEYKRLEKIKEEVKYEMGIKRLSWHDFIIILCDERRQKNG